MDVAVAPAAHAAAADVAVPDSMHFPLQMLQVLRANCRCIFNCQSKQGMWLPLPWGTLAILLERRPSLLLRHHRRALMFFAAPVLMGAPATRNQQMLCFRIVSSV